MNRSLACRAPLCALLILSCATAAWADYGAGQAAWEAGRYAEAMKEWRRAARKGDRRAMTALGRAFAKGLGVPQDFIEAHKWLNLAAARGDEKAAAERDALAKEMTVEERAEARKLLRAWRTTGKRRSTAIVPRRRTPGTPRPPRRMARKVSPGNAALRAVAAGDISALEKALAAGADANARGGKRGWTPLMYAADKGYTLLVPPLLKAGAKPNLRAADGATALFIAALHGRSELVEILMKAGADPAIKGPKGKTAEGLMAMRVARTKYGGARGLHKALRANERPAVIEALLDQGADIRGRDVVLDSTYPSGKRDPNIKYFYTPLHIAARYNKHPGVVALLLKRGADINEQVEGQYKRKPRTSENTIAQELAALWNENPEVAMFFIERAGGVNARGSYDTTPLHFATSNKNPELAKLLLDRGADVNARSEEGWTPLHWAASNKNPELAKLLLDRGANVNARNKHGRTPLYLASFHKNSGVVKVIENRARRNNRLHKALHANERPAVIKALLDQGADVNGRDADGRMPLHWAALDKNPEVAKLLLGRGADVNARGDKRGDTPLFFAAGNENPEVAKLLLDRGADVNAKDKGGNTPLHEAAKWSKNPEVTKLLLDRGANIKAVNDKGKTPAMIIESTSPQVDDNIGNED